MSDDGFDLVAHKTKVHLNNKQSSWMRDHCIACRLAYNFAIDRLRKPFMDYEACLDSADQPARFSSRIDGAIQPALLDFTKVKFPSAFDVSRQWTAERDILHPWMKEKRLNMDTISGVFNNNYSAALNQWKVAKWHRDKMPTYHGKGKKLTSTWRGRALKQIDARHFQLPGKMGSIKLGQPLRFDGEVRAITFSYAAGEWWASFMIKTKLPRLESAPEGTAVGIDVGVAQFASLSDGQQFAPAQDYAMERGKLVKIQRRLSKMQGPVKGRRKASKNWIKQNRKLQKQHARIANKRRHYTEIVSKDVATRFQIVAIEDLKLKNMTASAKGDSENPGKNVAQKSGLNRSILNGGFYQFRTRLEAKVKARGGQVIAVNPAYTSQKCPACGYVAKENRPEQSLFICSECRHTNNADINAAQNILILALSPDDGIVAAPRRKKERGQQGTSTPESLLTEPAAVLAKKADTQDALISAAKADSLEKKVKPVKQLDLLLQTAA